MVHWLKAKDRESSHCATLSNGELLCLLDMLWRQNHNAMSFYTAITTSTSMVFAILRSAPLRALLG
jgi:hypothetical protein